MRVIQLGERDTLRASADLEHLHNVVCLSIHVLKILVCKLFGVVGGAYPVTAACPQSCLG